MSLRASACLRDGQVPLFVERMSYARQKEISPNSKQNPGRPDAAKARSVLGAKQTIDEYDRPAPTVDYRVQEDGSIRNARLVFSRADVLQEREQITRRSRVFHAANPAFS